MAKDVFADPRTKQSDSLAHNAMVSLSQARKLLNEAAELRYRVTCEIEPDRTKLKSQFALDAIALYVRARNYDRLENLRFLCPNCHSQTPTSRGRNSRGKKKPRK